MPSVDQLVEVSEPSAPARKRRARAGQRKAAVRGKRVTSWAMTPEDELVLDALRDHYGTEIIGEAVRRGLRAALAAEGIELHSSGEGAVAA